MSTAASRKLYSPQEYLDFERQAKLKHEYRDGAIHAMSGASRGHCLIATNLAREVSQGLKGKPCETYPGAMRVYTPATGRYTYPDLVVACGSPAFQDGHVDTLLNPTLVVEILSPSTEAYDRGEKFDRYREIPSLREYVLVRQDRVLVERFTLADGGWVVGRSTRLDETLRLLSVGCDVPLGEVYARVDLAGEG